MEFNSLIFPAPNVSYTPQDVEGDIIYIPRFFKFNKDFRKLIKDRAKMNVADLDDADQADESANDAVNFDKSIRRTNTIEMNASETAFEAYN